MQMPCVQNLISIGWCCPSTEERRFRRAFVCAIVPLSFLRQFFQYFAIVVRRSPKSAFFGLRPVHSAWYSFSPPPRPLPLNIVVGLLDRDWQQIADHNRQPRFLHFTAVARFRLGEFHVIIDSGAFSFFAFSFQLHPPADHFRSFRNKYLEPVLPVSPQTLNLDF
jgi:hypothetical protein